MRRREKGVNITEVRRESRSETEEISKERTREKELVIGRREVERRRKERVSTNKRED